MPVSPCLLWLEATRIASAAFLPKRLYIGRTEHVPGQSFRDLQGAQHRSGVCHCGRIRRRNSALSQGSLKTKRSHYPALPLAQIRQLWSKKQMSSLITRAFFACGMSQVCSASVLLQLSLHPSLRGKAQLLGRRGGRTARRLSPEQHYGSDSSLPKMWREKAISAWHFWLRGRWREQAWGSKRFLFLPESNSWWGSDFISLVIIGLAGYPLEPHCIEWRARETSILLYGNCLAAILRCPLCDSKTNKQTNTH